MQLHSSTLVTVQYKGERLKRVSAILDMRAHYKPTETYKYTRFTFTPRFHRGVKGGLIKGKATKLREQIFLKQHSKRTSQILNRA